MKKPDKRETVNLFFSAFLIIAFIVCAHFFTQFTNSLPSLSGQLVTILIYVVFGLLVFYATRVGDGKAVKRFSVVTLIVLVVPSLYIIIASLARFMPLNSVFAANEATGAVSVIVALASVALGYGIPYTFISGFELEEEETAKEDDTTEVLEGGIEADLLESAAEESSDAAKDNAEEAAEPAEPAEPAEAEKKTEEAAE